MFAFGLYYIQTVISLIAYQKVHPVIMSNTCSKFHKNALGGLTQYHGHEVITIFVHSDLDI